MESKESRAKYMREYMRKVRLGWTPEQRAAHNAKVKARYDRRKNDPEFREKRRKTKREHMRRWYASLTPEERKARSLENVGYKKAWRLAHPEERKAEARGQYHRRPEHYREVRKAYGQRLKLEVMSAYGGSCKCCGEDELVFLSIDHINGDGAKHRRKELKESGMSFYVWLRKKGYPEGFQVLCMNCNTAKRTGGECPHRTIVMNRILSLVPKKGGTA